MSKTYEIGYKKPPKETQWKKGQSGNPAGRPKKKRPSQIKQRAHDVLSQKVAMKLPDGRVKNLDPLEAQYLALANKGLKGNDRALYEIIDLMLKYVPLEEVRVEENEAAQQEQVKMLIKLFERDEQLRNEAEETFQS